MPEAKSNFARQNELPPETVDALALYEMYRSPYTRMNFYRAYSIDVLPWGLRVELDPGDESIVPDPNNQRKKLLLMMPYSDKVFMSGLVSYGIHEDDVDSVAAEDAFHHWLNKDFGNSQNWRFFTAEVKIKFFNCYDGYKWELTDEFDPMEEPAKVDALLRRQLEQALRDHNGPA